MGKRMRFLAQEKQIESGLRRTVVVAAVVLLAGCGSTGSGGSATGTTSGSAPTGSTAATTSGSAARTTGSDSSAGSSAPASSATAATSGSADAAGYCTAKGGEVQTRAATWNTNAAQTDWLALANSAQMCRFQANDEAESRIYVDLVTLSSPEPTLAVLAHLAKVPMSGDPTGGNPATVHCSKLGGSSTYGSAGAAGGGWVNTADQNDEVVALCVFPDLSFIDEWGIAYYAGGVVRGIDLTTVMAYQPSGALPPVFPTG